MEFKELRATDTDRRGPHLFVALPIRGTATPAYHRHSFSLGVCHSAKSSTLFAERESVGGNGK